MDSHKRLLQINSPVFFCFLPIRSQFCFYFSLFLMLATLTLLIYAGLRYQKIKKLTLQLNVKLAFLIIVLQSTFFLTQFIIDDIYYITELKPDPLNFNPNITQTYSVINFIFFIFGGFFVQWLFLLVTFSIAKNTLNFYSKLGQIYHQHIMNLHLFFKRYLKIRWVRLLPVGVLMCWVLESTQMITITAQICLFFDVIDALISAILMSISYRKVLYPYLVDQGKISSLSKDQSINLSKKQRQIFKRQYLVLLFTAYFRLLSLIIFLIVSFFHLDQECPLDRPINQILLVVGDPFLKIIPVFFMIQLQLPTAKISSSEENLQIQQNSQLRELTK